MGGVVQTSRRRVGVPGGNGLEPPPGRWSELGFCGACPCARFFGCCGEQLVEFGEKSRRNVDHKRDNVKSLWVLEPPVIFQTLLAWPSDSLLKHAERTAVPEVLVDDADHLAEHLSCFLCGCLHRGGEVGGAALICVEEPENPFNLEVRLFRFGCKPLSEGYPSAWADGVTIPGPLARWLILNRRPSHLDKTFLFPIQVTF